MTSAVVYNWRLTREPNHTVIHAAAHGFLLRSLDQAAQKRAMVSRTPCIIIAEILSAQMLQLIANSIKLFRPGAMINRKFLAEYLVPVKIKREETTLPSRHPQASPIPESGKSRFWSQNLSKTALFHQSLLNSRESSGAMYGANAPEERAKALAKVI